LEAKQGDVPQFGKLRSTSYQLVVLKTKKSPNPEIQALLSVRRYQPVLFNQHHLMDFVVCRGS
jgi:hypothetical protein